MIKMYGIPNCDTVKKTQTWFNKKKIKFEFHDYKKEGITAVKLKEWMKQKDWTEILNKKSTTWKGLDEATQSKITDAKSAIPVLQEHTSLIKRPVVEKDGKIIAVGFKEDEYANIFK